MFESGWNLGNFGCAGADRRPFRALLDENRLNNVGASDLGVESLTVFEVKNEISGSDYKPGDLLEPHEICPGCTALIKTAGFGMKIRSGGCRAMSGP